MDRQEAIELIKDVAQRQRSNATEAIGEFKARLDENPVYAFEWGDRYYEAAAELDEANRLLCIMELVENPECEDDLDIVVPQMQHEAGVNLIDKVSGSTGQSHNLMDKAKAALAADWLRPDNRYVTRWLVTTVRHVHSELS